MCGTVTRLHAGPPVFLQAPAVRECFDILPHLLFVVDRRGVAEYWNAPAAMYLGVEWTLGRTMLLTDYVHSEDREQAARWRTEKSPARLADSPLRLRRHDGRYRYFLRRFQDIPGEHSRVIATATEVDDRERVLSALIDGPEFVCLHDPDEPRATYLSPRFLKFTGLPENAMVTADLVERFVHPDDFSVVAHAWTVAAERGQAEYDFRMRYPDGSFRTMHAVARADPDAPGVAPRVVITAQDVEQSRRTQQRLSLLVRAGEMFHRSLSIEETLANVAQLAVEDFADICIFDRIELGSERVQASTVAHRDRSQEQFVFEAANALRRHSQPHPAVWVSHTGKPYFVRRLDDDTIEKEAISSLHARFMRALQYRSKIVVPVTVRDRVFGALTFVLAGPERFFDDGDVDFAMDLARRAGVAIMNASEYAHQRHVAQTLQHAFLPSQLPVRPGMLFDAVYRTAKADEHIGGDWYDVFETRYGEFVIVVGDVTGSGIEAARTMIQLRQAIRVASMRTSDPGDMLSLANDALFVEGGERLATAWVGVIPVAARAVRYASAGHPPAFLRRADGGIAQLPQSGHVLGISPDAKPATQTVDIDRPSLLVLYTDGLTEHARDMLTGERAVAEVLAGPEIMTTERPAEYLESCVVRGAAADDLAIVTARFL